MGTFLSVGRSVSLANPVKEGEGHTVLPLAGVLG